MWRRRDNKWANRASKALLYDSVLRGAWRYAKGGYNLLKGGNGKRASKRRRYVGKSASGFRHLGTASTVMPRRAVSTLRYTENISLAKPDVGSSKSYAWVPSSLFDPNSTGTGHQPMKFDQIMAFYDHYNVISCSYRVRAINLDANPLLLGVMVTDGVYTPTTDWNKYVENGAKKILMPRGDSAGGKGVHTISGSVNIAKFMGYDSYRSTQNKGNISGSPSDNCFLIVFISDIFSNTPTQGVDLLVDLVFKAEFTEPKQLVQS